MTQAVKTELRMDPLRRSIGFDLSDLEANRRGVLTRRQMVHLLPGLLKVFAGSLAVYGFAAFLLYSLMFRGGQFRFQPLVLIEILACMAVPGFLAFGLILFARSVALDILEHRVLSIEGIGRIPIERQRDGSGVKSSRCISIGGARFEVRSAAITCFGEGLVYRVYFAPHSGTLLSIELCDQPVTPAPASETSASRC